MTRVGGGGGSVGLDIRVHVSGVVDTASGGLNIFAAIMHLLKVPESLSDVFSSTTMQPRFALVQFAVVWRDARTQLTAIF